VWITKKLVDVMQGLLGGSPFIGQASFNPLACDFRNLGMESLCSILAVGMDA
jgi:hypothetical protein